MNGNGVSAAKKRRQGIVFALAILPAIALGVSAMVYTGVSPVLWGQQIAAYAVFAVCAVLLRRAARRVPDALLAAVLLAFLAVSLFGAGAGGAKRWVKLALFNVNAAQLVIPALLVMLFRMRKPEIPLLCAAAVLCVQPDFSQLAALTAAALPVLWGKRKALPALLYAALLLVLAALCARIPVTIEPVPYCEGVLSLLGAQSPALFVSGAAALALIPGFWAYRFLKTKNCRMLSLAVYYTAVILFGLTGEYPVPFMGFGLSPVAGWWLAGLVMTADAGKSTEKRWNC